MEHFFFLKGFLLFFLISDEYMYEATSWFLRVFLTKRCRGGLVSSFIFNVDKTCDVVIIRKKTSYIHLHFDMIHLCMCISVRGQPRKLSEPTGSLQLAAGLSALLKRWYNQETPSQTMWLFPSAPPCRHENWINSNRISIVIISLGVFLFLFLFYFPAFNLLH